MGFELGRTYSVYEFLDVLRTSRSTAAYRVCNRAARREEQLQVLLESAQEDQEQVERFMREIGVRASLVHPNILAFYSAFVLEGRLVMTTELAEGVTVAERLEAGPLERREAVAIARQALSALACAHGRNVVHRDISPQNIVLANGIAKLANFALAKSHSSPQLTLAGAIVGNPRYIPPEQVRGTGELDARSDIYSLGAVLYEMLCGVPPFESTSQFEMMLAHVNGAVRPPSEIDASVPPELDAAVLKALAKHPAERYQTAEEFSSALAPSECGAGPRPAAASQAAFGLSSPASPPELPCAVVSQSQPQLAFAPASVAQLAAEPALDPPLESEWPLAQAPEPVTNSQELAEPFSETAEPALDPPLESVSPLAQAPEPASAAATGLATEPPAEPAERVLDRPWQPEPSPQLALAQASEPATDLQELAEPPSETPEPALVPPLESASSLAPAPEPAADLQPEPASPASPELAAETPSQTAEPALGPPLESASPLAQPPEPAADLQPEPAFAASPPSETAEPALGPPLESASPLAQPEPASAASSELAAEPPSETVERALDWPWQPVPAPQLALAQAPEPATDLQPEPASAASPELPPEPPSETAAWLLAQPPEADTDSRPQPASAALPELAAEPAFDPPRQSERRWQPETPAQPQPPERGDGDNVPRVPPPPPSPPLGWAIIGGAAAGMAVVGLAIWIFT